MPTFVIPVAGKLRFPFVIFLLVQVACVHQWVNRGTQNVSDVSHELRDINVSNENDLSVNLDFEPRTIVPIQVNS